MKFTDSTVNDIEQLTEWILADCYHKDCLDPKWWLTGHEGALTCFCLQDDKGPTMYVRLDKEEDLIRIHIQFGPEGEVSKSRVVKSIIKALPAVKEYAKGQGFKGFIYRSTSESLISFLQMKFAFVPVGGDDYQMNFEVG